MLKSLAKELKGKTKQWIKDVPKLTREEGRNKPYNISSPGS
jgi:hypothetical protein